MEVIEKFKRTLEMNKYLSGLCIVSFFYFSSIGYAHSVGIEKVQVNIEPYYTSRGFIPVISDSDEIKPSDFRASDCNGQQKLATELEFFQYRFSDSFGGNPPLYSCGLSAL